MKAGQRKKVGVATFAVTFMVALSVRATIFDDLNNLISTVNGLLGQARSSAKAAAQNSYNTLDSALRTSGNSVTNVAAAAKQSAYDSRTNINQLVNNSLVINPQDVTAPLQGLLDCIGAIQASATGTASSLNLITAAKQVIASEMNAAKAAAPIGSTTAATAVKAVQTAVSEADVLSQRVQAWSTALSRLTKETTTSCWQCNRRDMGTCRKRSRRCNRRRLPTRAHGVSCRCRQPRQEPHSPRPARSFRLHRETLPCGLPSQQCAGPGRQDCDSCRRGCQCFQEWLRLMHDRSEQVCHCLEQRSGKRKTAFP